MAAGSIAKLPELPKGQVLIMGIRSQIEGDETMGKVTLPKGFDPQPVKHWYVVANRAEALVYEGKLSGSFHYVKRLKNAMGKLTDVELVQSRPGRSFSSSRSGTRHGLEPRIHAHEKVAMAFARKIAKMLDSAVLNQECSDLVVVAEPHFLGLMNKELPKRVKAVIRQEVPREWSQGSDKDLASFLREKLS